jgi:hypothetical protein
MPLYVVKYFYVCDMLSLGLGLLAPFSCEIINSYLYLKHILIAYFGHVSIYETTSAVPWQDIAAVHIANDGTLVWWLNA